MQGSAASATAGATPRRREVGRRDRTVARPGHDGTVRAPRAVHVDHRGSDRRVAHHETPLDARGISGERCLVLRAVPASSRRARRCDREAPRHDYVREVAVRVARAVGHERWHGRRAVGRSADPRDPEVRSDRARGVVAHRHVDRARSRQPRSAARPRDAAPRADRRGLLRGAAVPRDGAVQRVDDRALVGWHAGHRRRGRGGGALDRGARRRAGGAGPVTPEIQGEFATAVARSGTPRSSLPRSTRSRSVCARCRDRPRSRA